MSNTTSIGDRAICNELSAVQIGSESKPVQTAYINNVIPTPAESLQNVCDVGNITTTSIQCGGLNSTALIQTAGAADIYSDGDLTANNDIEASNGDIRAPNGGVDCLAVMQSGNGFIANAGGVRADAGDITAVAGNLKAEAGQVSTKQIKITPLIDGGSSQAFPQVPPFSPIPDMTGVSKGAFWIYDPANATIQFQVETGIVDCVLNATTFISFNQYNTATPRRLTSYRIGQLGIAGADRSKLAVSCTFDGIVPSTDPVRVCLMIYPDP